MGDHLGGQPDGAGHGTQGHGLVHAFGGDAREQGERAVGPAPPRDTHELPAELAGGGTQGLCGDASVRLCVEHYQRRPGVVGGRASREHEDRGCGKRGVHQAGAVQAPLDEGREGRLVDDAAVGAGGLGSGRVGVAPDGEPAVRQQHHRQSGAGRGPGRVGADLGGRQWLLSNQFGPQRYPRSRSERGRAGLRHQNRK
jgi:hypothetical protein